MFTPNNLQHRILDSLYDHEHLHDIARDLRTDQTVVLLNIFTLCNHGYVTGDSGRYRHARTKAEAVQ